MANKTLADLRTAALQLSNYQNSGFIDTDELNSRINEAVLAYYDLVLESRETYFQDTSTFTLTGGLNGNTKDISALNLYKVQGLDFNPGTSSVETVGTLPSFRERNSNGRRSYDWTPDTLTIYPSTVGGGTYQLFYTPRAPVLADPSAATVTYPTITLDATGAAVDGTLHSWFFPTASFDATYIGKFLFITGAANAVNNGAHLITDVTDSTDITTLDGASEAFGSGVTAVVITGPLSSVGSGVTHLWTIYGADFTGVDPGSVITVAGSLVSNGTYTVVSADGAIIYTATGPTDGEAFGPGVTIGYQPPGTVPSLSSTLNPGALWIELFAGVSILDKAEQDSGSLQNRLGAQTKRTQDIFRMKQDEPKQVPLVRRRNYWGHGGTW